MKRAPILITLLALTATACTTPRPIRETRVEASLWKHLETDEFPACKREFGNVRDRHECMIDSAWLVWREAGLDWGPDLQNWTQALLTQTYLAERQARRPERTQRKGSAKRMDEAEWERIREAGDAAVEQIRHGRNRDWQAGYDQGFDDALPPVEDFNETYGAWNLPIHEKR